VEFHVITKHCEEFTRGHINNFMLEMSFKDWLAYNEGIQDEPYALHAVFMAGSPAAGKSTVARAMFSGLGFRFADPDEIYERFAVRDKFNASAEDWPGHQDFPIAREMRAKAERLNIQRGDNYRYQSGLPYVIDITSSNEGMVRAVKKELEESGYDTFMVVIKTTLDEALKRNQVRGSEGTGTISPRAAGLGYTKDVYEKLMGKEGEEGLVSKFIAMFGGTPGSPDLQSGEEDPCHCEKYGNLLVVDNSEPVPLPSYGKGNPGKSPFHPEYQNSEPFRVKTMCWTRWAMRLLGPKHHVNNKIGQEIMARGTDYQKMARGEPQVPGPYQRQNQTAATPASSAAATPATPKSALATV
jgi:hypothetical protein